MGSKSKKNKQKQQERKEREEQGRQKNKEKQDRKDRKKQKARAKAMLDSNEETKFSRQLEELGVRIKSMLGDGNCLFRSLADQIEGDPSRHTIMRRRIVDYMDSHRDFFSLFLEDDEPMDAYLRRMGRDGQWGGHQELFAASMVFNVKVVIMQYDTPSYSIVPDYMFLASMEGEGSESDNNTLERAVSRSVHLSYHGEAHYNSIRMLSDPDEPSVPAMEVELQAPTSSSSSSPEEKYREEIEVIQQALQWVTAEAAVWALGIVSGDAYGAIELLIDSESSIDQILELHREEEREKEREKERVKERLESRQAQKEAEEKEQESKGGNPNSQKRRPKRNRACPCSSGLKYKDCCKKWDMLVDRGQLTEEEAIEARTNGMGAREYFMSKSETGEIDEELAKLLQEIGI